MKDMHLRYALEKAQVMPLVVLMMFVIIGMSALILDGAAIMSNRRTAQAAADAGALAGAQRACMGKSDAKAVALNYAIANGATSATAVVTEKKVSVTTQKEHVSFFAKIFGEQFLKASAESTAGCYGVRGKSVIPLAWYCLPNNGGPFPDEYGCRMQTLNWKLIEPLVKRTVSTVAISDFDGNKKDYLMSSTSIVTSSGIPPEQIYIIIDSGKICKDVNGIGDIDCDLDDDGKNDIQTGGNRGWLYLTKDTSNITTWITNNGPHPNFILDGHKWLSGKSGVDVSNYDAMINTGYPGEVVLITVYNSLCTGDPRNGYNTTTCPNPHLPPFPAEPAGGDDFSEIRNTIINYHIITFAPFYISCVDKKGNCPGYRYAQVINSAQGITLKDDPVVEGFFLTGVKVSPDIEQGCDINLGNCPISLSK